MRTTDAKTKAIGTFWIVLLLPVVFFAGCALSPTGMTPPPNDADGDGVRDTADDCPDTPSGSAIDARGCTAEGPDVDGDAVPDSADRCEDTAPGAAVDATGCAAEQLDNDGDGDGVNDALDECARTPVTVEVDDSGCPVSAPGTPDSDDDGVPNDVDQCANTTDGADVDPNGCADSQLDTDGDNVSDDRDECPTTPPQTVVSANGCPETAPPPPPTGPAPVVLGTAGDFVILAKSGIDTVPNSVVTGDIGVSPIDSTAITGFSLTLDASTTFSTSPQVTGLVFAADYSAPTPAEMTAAISDMETAFTNAAGRPTPDFTELGAGDISGLTLVPGLYKWGTGVLISTDVTLSGGSNDVWIFQIAGGITQASATSVVLAGGALPKNIFWQAFGAVALDTTAHFEGIVLSQTEITLATGASINGRLLSQTAVSLDQNTVTEPAP
ncbi:MAG: DUF3494 domain-containing protein [Phycisphaerales bacterium]|nr:DUF3494 domain-containing protein [Phycisphaerales bacterium]